MSRDWAKSDMRKGHDDDGFARQTDPLPEPDQMNERITPNRTMADVRTMFEHRQALNDIVVDRQPMLRSAEDESLTPQIFPDDSVLGTMRMRIR